jgi:hypothetical protein
MREQRISGGRAQVIIEARYERLPTVDLVVRNLGAGVANFNSLLSCVEYVVVCSSKTLRTKRRQK